MIVAGVLLLAATSGARADYAAKLVGNWLTSAKEDRFGDGGTFTAATIDNRTALIVRCLQKKLSLAVMSMGDDPKPLTEKDVYSLKFRVDKQPIQESKGMAISTRLIQVVTEKPLVKAIRDGRETAMRLETADGVVTTHIFKTSGAGKAFADLARECPLD